MLLYFILILESFPHKFLSKEATYEFSTIAFRKKLVVISVFRVFHILNCGKLVEKWIVDKLWWK